MASTVLTPADKPKPPNAGKGRVKGVPNKTTVAAKEALALAFEGVGGVPALIDWARANQTEFYKLWSKLLPIKAELGGPDGERLRIEVVFEKPA